MFVGYSRFKLRASHVITLVLALVMVISYVYSTWASSRRYDAALPQDASDSVIKGLLSYEGLAGEFPKTLSEVEQRIWKHKVSPDFGETRRTLLAYNYHYIYFRKDPFTCTLWVLPAGPRRAEASAFFFYITTDAIRKWKGPEMSEDDIQKLKPLPEPALLGTMGMTEQPVQAVETKKQTQANQANSNSGRR